MSYYPPTNEASNNTSYHHSANHSNSGLSSSSNTFTTAASSNAIASNTGCTPLPLGVSTNIGQNGNASGSALASNMSNQYPLSKAPQKLASRPALQIVPLPSAHPSAPAPPQIPSHMQVQRQQSHLQLSVSVSNQQQGTNQNGGYTQSQQQQTYQVSEESSSLMSECKDILAENIDAEENVGSHPFRTASHVMTMHQKSNAYDKNEHAMATPGDEVLFCCQHDIRAEALRQCIAAESPIELHAMIPGADVHKRNGPRQFSWSESHVQRSLGEQALRRVRKYIESNSDVLVPKPAVCACEAKARVGEGLVKHAPPVSHVVYHSLSNCPIFKAGSERQAEQIAIRAKARHHAIETSCPHTNSCYLRKGGYSQNKIAPDGSGVGIGNHHDEEFKAVSGFSSIASESAQIAFGSSSNGSSGAGGAANKFGYQYPQQIQQSRGNASDRDRGVLGSTGDTVSNSTKGHTKTLSNGWNFGSTFRGGQQLPGTSQSSIILASSDGTFNRTTATNEARKARGVDSPGHTSYGMANGSSGTQPSATQTSSAHPSTMTHVSTRPHHLVIKHARNNSNTATGVLVMGAISIPQAHSKQSGRGHSRTTSSIFINESQNHMLPTYCDSDPVISQSDHTDSSEEVLTLVRQSGCMIRPRYFKPCEDIADRQLTEIPRNTLGEVQTKRTKRMLVDPPPEEFDASSGISQRYSLGNTENLKLPGPIELAISQKSTLEQKPSNNVSTHSCHAYIFHGIQEAEDTELNLQPPLSLESDSGLTSHHESPPVPGNGYVFNRRGEISEGEHLDTDIHTYSRDFNVNVSRNGWRNLPYDQHEVEANIEEAIPRSESFDDLQIQNGHALQTCENPLQSRMHDKYYNADTVRVQDMYALEDDVRDDYRQIEPEGLQALEEAQSGPQLMVRNEKYMWEGSLCMLDQANQSSEGNDNQELGRVQSHGSHIYRRSSNNTCDYTHRQSHNDNDGHPQKRGISAMRMGSAPKLILCSKSATTQSSRVNEMFSDKNVPLFATTTSAPFNGVHESQVNAFTLEPQNRPVNFMQLRHPIISMNHFRSTTIDPSLSHLNLHSCFRYSSHPVIPNSTGNRPFQGTRSIEPLEISDSGSNGPVNFIPTSSFHSSRISMDMDKRHHYNALNKSHFHNDRQRELPSWMPSPFATGSMQAQRHSLHMNSNEYDIEQTKAFDARDFQRDLFNDGYYYEGPSSQSGHHPCIMENQSGNHHDITVKNDCLGGAQRVNASDNAAHYHDAISPPIYWVDCRNSKSGSEAPSFANEFSAEEHAHLHH